MALWDSSQFGGSSEYDDLFQRILGNTGPNGFRYDQNNTQTMLDQYGNDFSQQFQNAVGRAPTADEINQFYTQAVNPVGASTAGFGGTDPNSVVQSYVPQAFQSQIQQNKQAQLPDLEKQISDVSSGVAQQTAKQLTDPNNPIYQQFSGSMNNLGITPGSGAFSSALGGSIGNSASSTMQSLLGSLGGGAISGNQSPSFQSLAGTGQNAAQGIAGYNQSLNDWNIQSALAEQMASMNQPSTFATDLGYANTASGIAKNLAGGAQSGMSAASATYICSELMRLGMLSKDDVDDLHSHIAPAIFKKGRAFWQYAKYGRKLLFRANEIGVDWNSFKPLFFDRVMAEPDPVQALNLYSDACKQLCEGCFSDDLWDERVTRNSVLDSLKFWPRLFFYGPFWDALKKIISTRMRLLNFTSMVGRHYGVK